MRSSESGNINLPGFCSSIRSVKNQLVRIIPETYISFDGFLSELEAYLGCIVAMRGRAINGKIGN